MEEAEGKDHSVEEITGEAEGLFLFSSIEERKGWEGDDVGLCLGLGFVVGIVGRGEGRGDVTAVSGLVEEEDVAALLQGQWLQRQR